MWPVASQIGREFYRRFINNLDNFQSVRVIDTGEIVPEVERGEMYTYQMRVYNISKSSPISNSRAKLWLQTEGFGLNVEVQTNLCWAPSKGTVTINRGDHEWLNLATIRPPKEEVLWGVSPDAELIFPTESGVLNPATVKISPRNSADGSRDERESITRQSLPLISVPGIFGTNNIKISSSNRPMRRYNLLITNIKDSIQVSVEPHRKGWSEKLTKRLFGLYDEGFGAGVELDKLGE